MSTGEERERVTLVSVCTGDVLREIRMSGREKTRDMVCGRFDESCLEFRNSRILSLTDPS